jgi:hypothetical protein
VPKADWISVHITYKYNLGGVQMYFQHVKVAPTDIFKRFRGLRFCATYGQYTEERIYLNIKVSLVYSSTER